MRKKEKKQYLLTSNFGEFISPPSMKSSMLTCKMRFCLSHRNTTALQHMTTADKLLTTGCCFIQ